MGFTVGATSHPLRIHMNIDFLFALRHRADLVYDIETYPNVFTVYFYDPVTGQSWYFEISEFRNDLETLCRFMDSCVEVGARWIGYNSLNFDYPVMHFIYQSQRAMISVIDIYNKAMSIINAPHNARFAHMIWPNDQIIPQIDLFKVHHFDNPAKSTSLKVLEFNMRSERVEDLPFPVGTVLTAEERDKLAWYNGIDVMETGKFLTYSRSAIEMRESLGKKFDIDFMNSSDVKIGEKILINSLEQRGIRTTVRVDNRNKKLQTDREEIDLGEVIFPYVELEHPEFRAVMEKLRGTTLTKKDVEESLKDSASISTKGVFKGLVANVDGLQYKFGTGGLHASLDSKIVRSDNRYQLVDVDVASYYPNLGIKNSLFPEHLTAEFCLAYEEIYQTRKSYPKGTPENEAYKLALNGSYGNSNNKYSSLYDPKYTMSITINGQLLLAMLVEQMLKIPGLKMVQANTDGITYLCPRQYLDHTLLVIDWWQELTKLELEEVHYDSMFIRDVNSYIAVKEDGKVKRIGAYAHETSDINPGTRELPWHKDWSFRIIAIAAEAVLVYGKELRSFIEDYGDVYAFFGRTKVPRSSKLRWGDREVPNIIRYIVTNSGAKLTKVMPPDGPVGQFKRANKLTDQYYNEVLEEIGLGVWDERIHTKNKSVYAGEKLIGVQTGQNVEIVDTWDEEAWEKADAMGADFADIDYNFYVRETEKLINLMEMN